MIRAVTWCPQETLAGRTKNESRSKESLTCKNKMKAGKEWHVEARAFRFFLSSVLTWRTNIACGQQRCFSMEDLLFTSVEKFLGWLSFFLSFSFFLCKPWRESIRRTSSAKQIVSTQVYDLLDPYTLRDKERIAVVSEDCQPSLILLSEFGLQSFSSLVRTVFFWPHLAFIWHDQHHILSIVKLRRKRVFCKDTCAFYFILLLLLLLTLLVVTWYQTSFKSVEFYDRENNYFPGRSDHRFYCHYAGQAAWRKERRGDEQDNS